MTETTPRRVSAELRKAISETVDCGRSCIETATYALGRAEHDVSPEQITLLLDCADLCRTTTSFLLRGSGNCMQTVELCGDVAAACARSLAGAGSDPRLQACIDSCIRAAGTLKQAAAPALVDYDKTVADTFPASDPTAAPSTI